MLRTVSKLHNNNPRMILYRIVDGMFLQKDRYTILDTLEIMNWRRVTVIGDSIENSLKRYMTEKK